MTGVSLQRGMAILCAERSGTLISDHL